MPDEFNKHQGAAGRAPRLTRNSFSLGAFREALGSRHVPDGGRRVESSGWSGIFGVGTAAGPRTVIARADSFTGPPRVAMPFNLENDDAESVESVRSCDALWIGTAFWTKGVLGAVYNWWRQGRRSVHGAARRGPGVQHVGGQTFVYPIHAVRLGDTVTFLPTPLRNWWGRPRLQQAWLGLSIYVIIVMSVKLGIYYFLSTSLIIFPTGAAGAALGTAASIRYLRKRHVIGSFDAAAAVEFTKLMALLSAILTILSLAAYIALTLAWGLREIDCNHKSLTECNAVDMCQNWSPCYVSNPPTWVNGTTDIVMGAIVVTAIMPYAAVCIMVFRRARAASYYLLDNML